MTEVVYVRWLDASYQTDHTTRDSLKPIELIEFGFLVHEDKAAITISIEDATDSEDFRLVLTIPRRNILDLRIANLADLLPHMAVIKHKRKRLLRAGTHQNTRPGDGDGVRNAIPAGTA